MFQNPFTPAETRSLLSRIAITLAALAVYRAAQWVPLPGLDLVALNRTASLNGMGSTRAMTSIMALGVVPLLTALIFAETAMSLSRRIRRWSETPDGQTFLWRGTVAGALFLAVLQGYGIATALEAVPGLVIAPGSQFRTGTIVSFVGATALIVWLAGWITRSGVGHGFWVIVAAAYADAVLQPFVVQLPLVAMGAMSVETYLTALAASVAVLAVAAAGLTALTQATPRLAAPEEFVWIPLMAATAVSMLLSVMFVLQWTLAPGPTGITERAASGLGLPMYALACAAFVLLRRRSLSPGERPNVPAAVPLVAMLVIFAGLQILFPHANRALLLAGVAVMLIRANRPATNGAESRPLAR